MTMTMHGLTSERVISTGDGAQHKQRRFYCAVHGYFDLFVFPNAAERHAKCCNESENAGAAAALPKAMAQAA